MNAYFNFNMPNPVSIPPIYAHRHGVKYILLFKRDKQLYAFGIIGQGIAGEPDALSEDCLDYNDYHDVENPDGQKEKAYRIVGKLRENLEKNIKAAGGFREEKDDNK